MKTPRFAFMAGTAAAVLLMTAPAIAQQTEPVPVVASFSILGDMVKQVGGKHVSVTTLVGPDGDTHVYQPTPADARALSNAKVLIENGLEFEGWIKRLVEASGFRGARVVTTTGIKAIPFEEGNAHGHDDHKDDDHKGHDHAKHDDHKNHGHARHDHHKEHDHGKHDDHKDHAHAKHDDHKDHGHGKHGVHKGHGHAKHDDHKDHDDHAKHDGHHGHDHGAFDPHAWQSLSNAVIYIDNITAALAKADPENAGNFYRNRAAYVAEIKALDAEIRAVVAKLPKERRKIITSHDAFQYFGRDYGLTFLAPQGLSTESEASAKDVARLIRQMREQRISAVFVENVADARLLKQIANETKATIGGTLYPGALSGPEGPASTYLRMMRHNAMTLVKALGS